MRESRTNAERERERVQELGRPLKTTFDITTLIFSFGGQVTLLRLSLHMDENGTI